MRRTSGWLALFTLFLGGVVYGSQELSPPRALPTPPPGSEKTGSGKQNSRSTSPRALYPVNPFPPPDPPVVDPRTGAWQQVHGGPGVRGPEGVVGEASIEAGGRWAPLQRWLHAVGHRSEAPVP
jgi:hypothetical protein